MKREIVCPDCGHRWMADPADRDAGLDCPACRRTLPMFAVQPTFLSESATQVAASSQPERIGTFRILSRLGAGGMGTVYLAEDPTLDRLVAIKILRADRFADSNARMRFAREAKALAKVEHPNVVSILHVGLDEEFPYLVMEYVEGDSIDHKIHRQGPIEFETSRRIIRGVLLALRHAHQAGIVHRDIKPGNILVHHDGSIKLTDFGLAQLETEQTKLTQSGLLMGTPNYMSPEQWGAEDDVGPASDIYSIGVTWFYMLAGTFPIEATRPVEILSHMAKGKRVSILERRPDIPPVYAKIIDRMTALKTSERFASCEEVLAALEEAPGLASASASSRVLLPVSRGLRHPAAFVGLGVVGLLVLVFLVIAALSPAPQPAPPETKPAVPVVEVEEPAPIVRQAPQIELTSPPLAKILLNGQVALEGALLASEPIHSLTINHHPVESKEKNFRSWRVELTLDDGQDQWLVGRIKTESGELHEETLWQGTIDTTGPVIRVTRQPKDKVALGDLVKLAGVIEDLSAVQAVRLNEKAIRFWKHGDQYEWETQWVASPHVGRFFVVAVDAHGHESELEVPIPMEIDSQPLLQKPERRSEAKADPSLKQVGDLSYKELPSPGGEDSVSVVYGSARSDSFYALWGGKHLVLYKSSRGISIRTGPPLEKAVGLAYCDLGPVLGLPDQQSLWLLDRLTMEPVRKVQIPPMDQIAASPHSSLVFATSRSNRDMLTMVDMSSGSIQKQFSGWELAKKYKNRVKGHADGLALRSFERLVVSPKARSLFVASSSCIHRLAIQGRDLVYAEYGPRIGSGAGDLVLSPDGRSIAMPTGGGNRLLRQDEAHAPYSTFVYSATNLSERTRIIRSGSYPRTLAFGVRSGEIYAQNYDQQLLRYDRAGNQIGMYVLTRRGDETTQIRVDPSGERLLLATRAGKLFWIQIPK